MVDPVPVRAVLGTYPHTIPLKDGSLTDPAVTLAFEEIEPIHRAFAPMAREQRFDVSEMAIVTALQAFAYGKPIMLLPVVVAARFQQRCLICNNAFQTLAPADIVGKRVGVRAYTQTTGMWVRAILASEYGVQAEQSEWITYEGAHLAEYHDPAFVRRAPEGGKLVAMLRDGELDAAILGNDLPDDPRYQPVIAEPDAAARAWYQRHHVIPINHVVVVTQELALRRPDAVRAIYRLLRQGRDIARAARPDRDGIDLLPSGMAVLTPSLNYILQASLAQGLLPRAVSTEELFADAKSVLGSDAG
jgi:4,5-dihydroxyphthalate decarboxylase